MRNTTVDSPAASPSDAHGAARIPRRQFLGGAAAAAGQVAGAFAGTFSGTSAARASQPANRGAFQLRYAPHFGMFRHHAGDDHIDQIRFGHDEGFRALEDNGMGGREPALQEKIAA